MSQGLTTQPKPGAASAPAVVSGTNHVQTALLLDSLNLQPDTTATEDWYAYVNSTDISTGEVTKLKVIL